MKKTLSVFFVCTLLDAGFELAAQELTTRTPVLRIFREDIKEAKGMAHERSKSSSYRMVSLHGLLQFRPGV